MAKLQIISKPDMWVRPIDWVAVPKAVNGEFYGLLAVFDNNSNFIAFAAAGNYTVDWGDGSGTENVSSGVTAQHQYTYSSISSGTYCTRGYRQVIVKITPQAGQDLSSIDLQKRHSSASAFAQAAPWLDISLALTSGATSPAITVSGSTPVVKLLQLESFEAANTSGVTVFTNMFNYCYALRNINNLDTSSCTNFSNMFASCYSLRNAPELNTASGTNFGGMFINCLSLRDVPAYNTSAGTAFNSMFASCSALTTIPLLNTGLGTTFYSMFSGCSALITIPELNTASGTIFGFMFASCIVLTAIPTLSTAAGTDFGFMFSGCSSLQAVPALTMSGATSYSNTFNSCNSLSKSQVTGTGASISYTGCNLSATDLNAIYTNLPTVTAKTITVTGNYGAASDTPSIATAKGWTVTG